MTTDKRFCIASAYLYILGGGLFFWWPLSHWFYPEFYHHLLGFADGSWQRDMVTVIGTCGVMPVCVALFSARNVRRNRDGVLAIIIFALAMGVTYLYLIISGAFPKPELINTALCFFTAAFLSAVYPWGYFSLRSE